MVTWTKILSFICILPYDKVSLVSYDQNKLITVTPDTKVLRAMQLMTDDRIRHIPVVDDKGMIGMVSIGDVVRAVLNEHREELDRLNACTYIYKGVTRKVVLEESNTTR
ncbi:unnamed protein product [Musa acuminata subsp. malaccensis]|uniref:(wild Malaysian banana) hypothetical protein n=1 Tax=Musa acuminata subsp. malaccensis TaxID=214687 RepID=A0A804ITQ3_MUSAM|nr:unnamed protein product [Musa acuminata subsp. malaccensis]